MRFRALAARANYLAADRIDVLYAAKEVCRFMSRPTNIAIGALKRLARYLRSRPRMVFDLESRLLKGLSATPTPTGRAAPERGRAPLEAALCWDST